MKKIIIVSPGAGGKNHLLNFLEEKGLKIGISYTTRPKRSNEVDGVDYHFISENSFIKKIEKGEFFEYNRFKDWYYGKTFEEFNNKEVFIVTPNRVPLLNRDKCFIIFLNIPEEVRRQRLIERNDINDDVERRIEADKQDFKDFKAFDLEIKDEFFNCEEIFKLIEKL